MQQALLLARNELGEDAVVLNTKHVRTGGILGIGGADKVELMAAIDETQVQTVDQPRTATAVVDRLIEDDAVQYQPSQQVSQSVVEDIMQPTPDSTHFKQLVQTSIPDPAPSNSGDFIRLQSEVQELSGLVRNLLSGKPQSSPGPSSLMESLGIDEDVMRSKFSDCRNITDPEDLASILGMRMSEYARPLTLGNHDIIAIIGPTGVGKTTTLAKLAAYFSLELGKSVAMVTADTFRIGAVEQLRTYARIMGIPLEIALSPEDITEGISKHADKDIILIDTVGRSQRSSEHIEELQAFINAAKPTQTHLVVSASAASQIQNEVVSSFASLSPTHIIVTKLDESPNRGCLINLPFRTGLGISCMTAGQNVPQDIEFATPNGLAHRITEVA